MLNYREEVLLDGTFVTTEIGDVMDISHSLGAAVQVDWTNDTTAGKTAVTGTSEVHTLNFADKGSTTNGDYISITDTNGDKWAASLSVNGIREISSITAIAEGSVAEKTQILVTAEGSVKEVTNITCIAEGGVREQTSITCVADVAGSLDQSGFVIYDSAGSVAVWIDATGASPTPAWTAGYDRALKLVITAGDAAATIAGLLSTLLVTTDGNWTEVSNALGVLVVQDVGYGIRTDAVDVSSTFTISTAVQGVNSSLDGKYFILSDNAGTVAFWIDVDNSGTAEPSHGADRAVEITTVTSGMTDAQVQGVVFTAVDDDAEFASSGASGASFVVTDDKYGARTEGTAGDSGFTVARSVAGHASNLHTRYFILKDEVGTVAFWFDVDDAGGAAPSHGADRAVEITTITSTMAIGAVGTAVYNAIDADAKFNGVSDDTAGTIVVVSTTYGDKTGQTAGDSGFTVTQHTAGVDSALTGKYFLLGDVDGTVGVWFDVGNEGTTIPAGASGADRALEITTVTRGMSAAQVAGALRTAIDADGKFDVGTLTDATFTAICLDYKSVANINAGDSGFTVSTVTQGSDLCAAPTGAIWTSIAAGKKCQVDISTVTNDEDIAPLVKTAMDLLTGFTALVTLDHSAADGTMLVTHVVRAPVAVAVPKNTDDSGAGSIAVTDSVNGVASTVNVTNDTITIASHGWTTGSKIDLTINSGTLPAGTSATAYYIIVVDANTVSLASSLANALAGTVVDITDQGDDAKIMTLTPTAVAGGVVHMECSNDGLTWADIASMTANITASSNTMFVISNAYYKKIRPHFTCTAGTVTIKVTAGIKESE